MCLSLTSPNYLGDIGKLGKAEPREAGKSEFHYYEEEQYNASINLSTEAL